MASSTKKTKVRRRIKIAGKGTLRKNHDRKYGSTLPNLPLTKPNANEQAQKQPGSVG
jgi:hypothetical protein